MKSTLDAIPISSVSFDALPSLPYFGKVPEISVTVSNINDVGNVFQSFVRCTAGGKTILFKALKELLKNRKIQSLPERGRK